MTASILYRLCSDLSPDEFQAMEANFRCFSSRLDAYPEETVIARFSCLPFYKELEEDLERLSAKLVNSYAQHRWIADLGSWTDVLGDLTPRTWRRLDDVPEEAYPVVIKGETNSKKFLWDTHVFAKNRQEAVDVVCRLQDDGLISGQWIYARQFVPLRTYLIGLRGLPITEEYRVFCYKDTVLSRGYYWSNYFEDLPEKPDPGAIPESFLKQVTLIVKDHASYYTVDVARTASGNWIVIEINDGQLSGLSENDPKILYEALKHAVDPDRATIVDPVTEIDKRTI